MNTGEIIICIKSSLIYRGLVHCIHNINSEISVSHISEIEKIFNDNMNTFYIIDISLLPDPAFFFLEKCVNEYPDSKLIAFTESNLSEKLSVYFSESILMKDTESEIEDKLRKHISGIGDSRNTIENNLISEREQEILKYVASGFTNKEISNELHISSHTVITHRKNITAKLGIKTIAGLAVYAVINGIITPEEMP